MKKSTYVVPGPKRSNTTKKETKNKGDWGFAVWFLSVVASCYFSFGLGLEDSVVK